MLHLHLFFYQIHIDDWAFNAFTLSLPYCLFSHPWFHCVEVIEIEDGWRHNLLFAWVSLRVHFPTGGINPARFTLFCFTYFINDAISARQLREIQIATLGKEDTYAFLFPRFFNNFFLQLVNDFLFFKVEHVFDILELFDPVFHCFLCGSC